jgi:hypothetical protein
MSTVKYYYFAKWVNTLPLATPTQIAANRKAQELCMSYITFNRYLRLSSKEGRLSYQRGKLRDGTIITRKCELPAKPPFVVRMTQWWNQQPLGVIDKRLFEIAAELDTPPSYVLCALKKTLSQGAATAFLSKGPRPRHIYTKLKNFDFATDNCYD